jgi:hypothetical protein
MTELQIIDIWEGDGGQREGWPLGRLLVGGPGR